MSSGHDKNPNFEDKDLEQKIKRPAYTYPVPFTVFWKEVKGKIRERENRKPPVFIQPVKWKPLVYAAASLAVVLILFLTVPPYFRPAATVTMLRGVAETKAPSDNKWHRLRLGERLAVGAQMRTGTGGGVEVQIGQDSLVRLNENAKLTLKSVTRDFGTLPAIVKLEQGSAVFSPKLTKPGQTFRVLTSLVNISANDRRFTVAVAPEGNIKVAAVEGPVLLEPVLQASQKDIEGSTALQDLQQAVQKEYLRPVTLSNGMSAEVSRSAIDRIGNSLSSAAVRLSGNEPADRVVQEFNKEMTGNSPAIVLGKNKPADIQMARQLEDKNTSSGQGLKVSAEFTSDPQDALVTVNDRPMGPTPFSALMRKDAPLSVTVYKKGFAPMATNLVLTGDAIVKVLLSRTSDQPTFEITDGRSFPENLEWFENLPADILNKPVSFNEGSIFCSDGNTLKIYENKVLIKTVVLGKDNINSGKPLFFNGRVYVTTENGGLYIYSPAADELRVIKDAGRVRTNLYPLLAGRRILLPSQDKGLEIYSDDGELIRRIPPEQNGSAAAVPYYNPKKDILVLNTTDDKIIALGASMEKRLWSINTGPEKIIDPLTGNDENVFMAFRDSGSLSACNLSTGKLTWRKVLPELVKSEIRLAANNSRLYVTAASGTRTWFYSLNAVSGEMEYLQEFPGQLLRPLILEGKVVLISRKGKTALFDPAGRKMEYSSILK